MIIQNLNVSFNEKIVFNNFSFDFGDSGLYFVDGVSGKGKTTLFNVIAGVLKPDSGKVELCGKKVAYMFQEDRLFNDFTVLENVICVTNGENEDIERSKKILCELGLENDILSYPKSLSGGMLRRVALARTLAYDGDILLLDEAFKGLDEETCRIAIETTLKYSRGKLVIVAAHMIDKKFFGDCSVIRL